MPSRWHRFVGRGSTSRREAILQSLAGVGVSIPERGSEDAGGPGVLFFDEINQQTCDLVQQLSRRGLVRLLAVATSSSQQVAKNAWKVLRSGASDVFAWDYSASSAERIAAEFERWEHVDRIVRSSLVRDNLVGNSPVWISVLRQIVELAIFTDASILITGESGTGKELVARLIHTLDTRPEKRDLVVLDCTTIVPELSGSEFFGHERGAFTGAIAERDGAFALADKGTLFLDEVGDLPLSLQAELLRVVQEHTYKRVGGNVWHDTDFRLVCATNRDLQQEESEGRFRRDFYYRIASWTCKLPPLRERPEDILPLASHFLNRLRPTEEKPEMDLAVREYLVQRAYPGNIRDLKQVISRMSYSHAGPGPITAGDVPEEDRPRADAEPTEWRNGTFELAIRRAISQGASLREITQTATDTAIRVAVDNENGNLRRAAEGLGVTDRALQMRRAAQRQRVRNDGPDAPPRSSSGEARR